MKTTRTDALHDHERRLHKMGLYILGKYNVLIKGELTYPSILYKASHIRS